MRVYVFLENDGISSDECSEEWNEKSNAFNKIIDYLESLSIKDESLICISELIREYEEKLITLHSLDNRG